MNSAILAIISVIVSGVLFVPFINMLYFLKLRDPDTKSQRDIFGKATPIFDQLRKNKTGTPIGGGLLVVLVTAILFAIVTFFMADGKNPWSSHQLYTAGGLLLTFLSFMCIGLYDDIKKTFKLQSRAYQLTTKQKLVIQVVISLLVSWFLVDHNLVSVRLPFMFNITEPLILIPAVAVILTFLSNAFNITDGVDGLASGLLFLALLPLWVLAGIYGNFAVAAFIGILEGSILAFLYFNINPARVFMGDSGALAFGAVLAVIAMMIDTPYLLPIVGFIFIIEALSSIIQWCYKRFLGKKLFPIAPLHYTFEYAGWSETKVVFRAWLLQMLLSLVACAFMLYSAGIMI